MAVHRQPTLVPPRRRFSKDHLRPRSQKSAKFYLTITIIRAFRYLGVGTAHPDTAEYVIMTSENPMRLLIPRKLTHTMELTISNLDTSPIQMPPRLSQLVSNVSDGRKILANV